jgi:hypothetical protein
MNYVSNISAINKSQLKLNIQHRINWYICPIVFPSTVLFSTLGLATFETYVTALRTFEKLCVNSAPEIAKLTAGLPYWLCVNTYQPRWVHHSILFDIPLTKLCQTYSCVVAEWASWQQNIYSVPQPKIFTAKNKNPYWLCLPFINKRKHQNFSVHNFRAF